MRCALINLKTNTVENVIMADPETDTVPKNFLLVSLSDDSPVFIEWFYNPITESFSEPIVLPLT